METKSKKEQLKWMVYVLEESILEKPLVSKTPTE